MQQSPIYKNWSALNVSLQARAMCVASVFKLKSRSFHFVQEFRILITGLNNADLLCYRDTQWADMFCGRRGVWDDPCCRALNQLKSVGSAGEPSRCDVTEALTKVSVSVQ